jgi:hypothetical protein
MQCNLYEALNVEIFISSVGSVGLLHTLHHMTIGEALGSIPPGRNLFY